MAITGVKTFTAGSVLTASDVNQYLSRGVFVFASAAARTTAFSSASITLTEGWVSYLQDTNAVEVYDGTAWVGLAVSPLLMTQGGATSGQALTWSGSAWAPTTISADWQTPSGTWTYASVDGPTGVITTSVDQTGVIPVGSRLKLTQTTVRYFIVTATSPTTVTVYGGTDYTLANAAISSVAFSQVKAPVGMNISPAKWTESFSAVGPWTKTSPTLSTWYGGALLSGATPPTLAIPIGVWNVDYQAVVEADTPSAAVILAQITLSTTNNSETDVEFSAGSYIGVTGIGQSSQTFVRAKTLTLAAKTTYTLCVRFHGSGTLGNIQIGYSTPKNVIRAVCAYL